MISGSGRQKHAFRFLAVKLDILLAEMTAEMIKLSELDECSHFGGLCPVFPTISF